MSALAPNTQVRCSGVECRTSPSSSCMLLLEDLASIEGACTSLEWEEEASAWSLPLEVLSCRDLSRTSTAGRWGILTLDRVAIARISIRCL